MKNKIKKPAKRTKQLNRSTSGTVALFILLLIIGAFMVVPMVLAIGNSFKPLDELWLFPPRLLPKNPTLKNFSDMFSLMSDTSVSFFRYLFNTVFITVLGTAGHIILSSMCAYPLAKKNFPAKNFIFSIIVLSLMFNAAVTTIPNFLVVSTLKITNTYLACILPTLAGSLGLYLMKQFMEQIPDSIIEAAEIDGASNSVTFWRIVMPNVRSAWLTLMLLCVQNLWNAGASPYIFSEELKTMPYALSQLMSVGVTRAGAAAAVSVLMMSVPIIIFVVNQSKIIETMSSSGMKD